MREQLIQYVNLLFAGAPDSDEMRQEILQNTLDRYDDLLSQGKTPEAAYRLAISGIGDINEILGTHPQHSGHSYTQSPHTSQKEEPEDPNSKKLRAIAVAMYILCPTPLFILSELGMETLGLCLTLAIVATATYLISLVKKNPTDSSPAMQKTASPRQELKNSISTLIWAVGLAVYFVLSFATNAWYITWVLFPMIGCVQGLVKACMDLKEANLHEN